MFAKRALLELYYYVATIVLLSVPGTEAGPAALQRRRDIPGKKRARAAGLVAHDRCTLLLTWVPYTFMRTRCNTSSRPRSSCIAHAGSCGETTRRHNAYARAVRAVAHAFPGQPQIRVEATGIPDADSRMDLVVSGAATPAAGEPGSPPDGRTLLIDVSITEPLGARPMSRGSYTTANVAAEIRRKEKETRYGAVVDTERHKLVPWAVETWGRHDVWLVKFLRGVAEIAATDRERPSCGDDAAERRRVARLRETIFATWMQRLGAGLAVAVAEHFDARFRPLRGTVARQGGRAHVPAGMEGACALDQGLLGVGGHARCMEPLYGFFMRCC